MKYAKFANRLMIKNWRSILIFELFYKFLLVAGFTPFVKFIINQSMEFAGIKYLGNDNIYRYFLNPAVLVLLFLLLLMILFFSFIELIAIIQAFDASYHDTVVSFRQILRKSVVKALGIFQQKNWKFVIYVLLVIPMTGLLGAGSFINSLEIPGFILDYAGTKIYLLIGFIFLGIILIMFSFKWAFSIHYYTLENCTYKEAVKKSAELMKGNVFRTIFSMISRYLRLIVFVIAAAALSGVSAFMLSHFRLLYDPDGKIVINTILWTLYLLILVMSLIAVPIAYSLISALYYGYNKKKETGENPSYKTLIAPSGDFKPLPALNRFIVVLICIGMAVLLTWQFTLGSLSNYDTSSNRPAIVSHRGNSSEAPENSIPAFEKAIESGVQWIELDVHQTKDGVVVVTHDSNLKRICGVNKNVYDITYEELSQYDSGSWFSPEYSDIRVATLAEVFELCKGKVRIQIELKPTGHEPNFEQNVIDLIREYGFEDSCVLASMDLRALEKCKALAPDLQTLYIMTIAAGNLSSLDYIDGFSIEETFATSSIIKRIHDDNKNCYVWTINNPSKVYNLLENNIDGILTDYPEAIEREIDSYYSNDPMGYLLNLLKISDITDK